MLTIITAPDASDAAPDLLARLAGLAVRIERPGLEAIEGVIESTDALSVYLRTWDHAAQDWVGRLRQVRLTPDVRAVYL